MSMCRWFALLVLALGTSQAQLLTFNTFVFTNQGQVINARLEDNVYLDMSTSPPTLRAKRPSLGVLPALQPDGTWIIPAAYEMAGGFQVFLNGLLGRVLKDYKIDPGNPRRLIPWADRLDQQIKWEFETGEPWTVQVNLYP